MKIIFLDIDGVICLSREWGSRGRKIKRWELEGGEGEPPVTIRLDDFIKNNKINNILLIKIDVDGNELDVLQSAKKFFI